MIGAYKIKYTYDNLKICNNTQEVPNCINNSWNELCNISSFKTHHINVYIVGVMELFWQYI